METGGLFIENFNVVTGLSPNADLFNTSPVTDVVNMTHYQSAVFMVPVKANGASATGVGTMKPQAVSSVAASNATDLGFWYAKKTTAASSVWGAITRVDAGGTVAHTAGEDTIFMIEVQAREMPDTSKYLLLKLAETVNAPIVGAVQIILCGGRFGYPWNIDVLA